MSQISTDQSPAYIPSEGPAFKPLSRHDVAGIMGVSVRTIENWRRDGLIPPSAGIGGRVYWHPDAFYEGLNAKLRGDGMTVENGALPIKKPAGSGNRAPESTGALAKSRKRSADAIAAMSNKR